MEDKPGESFAVAIDGPAGAGKSTLARRLSEALGLPHVNTGLMYRAVAARALAAGVSTGDGDALADLAHDLSFTLSSGEPAELLIDGHPAEPLLSSDQVEGVVSAVSRHAQVRAVLRAEQRRLAAESCVMEGRDIGSVVLPNAQVKIYLLADPQARADRRRRERGGVVSAGEAVATRDAIDAQTNPFVPAPDAVILDTTALSQEDVFAEALAVVRRRAADLGLRPGRPGPEVEPAGDGQ